MIGSSTKMMRMIDVRNENDNGLNDENEDADDDGEIDLHKTFNLVSNCPKMHSVNYQYIK